MQNIESLSTNPKRWSMPSGMDKRIYGALAGLALLAAGSAQAQLTWEAGSAGGAGDGAGAWLTGNWWNGSSDQTWTSGSDAVFGHGGAGGAVTLGSPTTANSITLSNFTGTYTLGSAGNTLTINAGITNTSGAAATTILSPITLGGDQTWLVNSTSGLTLSSKSTSPVTVNNGGYTWTVDGSGLTQWTSDQKGSTTVWISGAGGLTKNGSGTLMIIGNNNQAGGYAGTTTINGGVLRSYLDALGVGSGNLTLNGGVYEHYWNGAFTRSLGSGAGQVQILGGASGFSENGNTAATFTLNNSATYEVVWGAAGEAGNPNATGYFNPSTFVLQESTAQSGAALTLANKIDLNGTTRTIRSSGAGTSSGTISGVIRDSQNAGAGLTKTGVGTLKLTAANTYPGNTTINAGILNAGVAETAGTSGPFGKQAATAAGTILFGGGTLQYSSANSFDYSGRFSTAGSQPISIDVNGQNVTFATALQGTGTSLALTSSTGTGSLTLSATNTYDGTTTVNKGTLTVNSSLASGSAVTVNSGGTLAGSGTINGSVTVNSGGALAGSGTFNGPVTANNGVTLTAGTMTFNGSVTANSGATLSGSGTISGAVSATGAYISPAGVGTIGTLTLSNGLALNASSSIIYDLGDSSGSSDLIAITGALALDGTSYVAFNVPSGAPVANNTYTIMTFNGLTGSGTLVFPNGSTTMNGATLNVGTSSVTVTIGASGISTGTSADIWTGATSYVWDSATPNWNTNGVAGLYTYGDNVTFDDTGKYANPVTGTPANPGSVTVNSTKNYTIAANIGGTGSLTKSGTSTLTLSGANTYSGGTTLSQGTVTVSTGSSLGTGDITVSGSSTLNLPLSLTIPGNLAVNAALTMKDIMPTTANTITFGGVLSGSGAISISGNGNSGVKGEFAFTNSNNTWTGDVTMASGNTVGYDQFSFNSIGDGGKFTLQKTGNQNLIAYTGSPNIAFNSRAIKVGAIKQIFDGNGVNPVNMFANNGTGTVAFNSDMTVGAVDAAGGTLFFGGSNTGTNTFAGTIPAGTGGAFGIGKTGAGKWILTGLNSYAGETLIRLGTLSVNAITGIANNQPLGKNAVIQLGAMSDSGTLEFTGSASSTDKTIRIGNTTASHTGAGTILNNGTGTLTFSASPFNPAISGITATRTLTLGGSYSGGANEIQGGIQDNVAGTGKVALTKNADPSIWILSGANTYTGNTTVNGGTLLVNGSLAGSAVTVKTNATLGGNGTIGGALTVQPGGTLVVGTTNLDALTVYGGATLSGNTVFRIAKSALGTAQNQLQGSYTTAGGTLTVTNITTDPGYALAPGDSFPLFPAGMGGSFTNYNLPSLPLGLSWDKAALAGGTLTVTDIPSTPVFTPPTGNYVGALTVTIASDPGTTILYTTDGSMVVASASPATVVVPVNTAPLTITAYATNLFGKVSAVASATFSTVARPTWIDPSSIGYWTTQTSWSNNVVANGRDVTADFSALALSADTTVYLDTPQTVGNLLLGDAGNTWGWTLADYGTGPLTLDGTNSTIAVGSSGATITAVLAGTNTIAKTGVGTLLLTNVNSRFTGDLTINGGVLVAGGGNPKAANPTVGGLGSSTATRTLTVNPGATLVFGDTGIYGNHQSVPKVTLAVNSGAVVTNTAGGNPLGPVMLNGGTLTSEDGSGGIWGAYYLKGDVTVGGTNASTMSPSTASFNVGSATVRGITFNVADATADASPDLIVSATLIDGVVNTVTSSGWVSQPSFLTKTGPGTMLLTATNTYTGTTTISNGTLLVNGSLSSTNVLVAGGTLGGNGTVGGSVIVADGGNLAPGASVGTLSIGGDLDVSAMAAGTTGKLRYELDLAGASDSIAVTGALTIGSGVLGFSDFAFTNVGGLQAGTYTLITTSGGVSGTLNPADLSGALGAFTGTLQINGNNLELVVTASVPLTPPVLTGHGTLAGTSFPLTFSGPSGQTYKVLSSTNVALPLSNWNVLTTGTFGADPVNYTDTGATNAHQFYRIQSP